MGATSPAAATQDVGGAPGTAGAGRPADAGLPGQTSPGGQSGQQPGAGQPGQQFGPAAGAGTPADPTMRSAGVPTDFANRLDAATAAPATPPAGMEGAFGVPQAGLGGAPPVAAATAPQAPPPTPGPLATQVAMRIVPLRLDADGIHRLTVNLHPVDLGPVQVVAEIRNGAISVQLSGSTEAGNDALRHAMDDLRRQLEDAGFGNTTLDLREGGSGPHDQAARELFRPDRGGRPTPPGPTPADEPAVRRPGPTPDGRLDIQA